jgi:transposase
MAGRWELTDEQWELVEPALRPVRREDNRGRPWHDTRAVLNGVLWILGSGAQWAEMPSKYPPYQTCHRRFQQWVREGRFVEVLRLLAGHLHERGKLNLDEAFVDATFASAKKGASPSVPTKRGKGTKIVAIASGDGLPLAVTVESASPAECKLVEAVLAGCFLDELPERLIGDKAYDSDALDQTLAEEYGVEMISPNRSNRKQKTQDGRPLRRYRRRWKIERVFAWMHNYRRLVTRWEYHIENFLGFVQLACLLMLLRHL